jgi:hypothetical protein
MQIANIARPNSFGQSNSSFRWFPNVSRRQTISSSGSSFVLIESPFKIVDLRLTAINSAWKKEYDKYKHYIKGDTDNFFNQVDLVNKIISKVKYKDFDIELTPSNSIVYDLLLPNNQMLVIRKSFEKYEDKAENDVVFSIFENKTHILSGIKDLNELVSLTNNYIEM